MVKKNGLPFDNERTCWCSNVEELNVAVKIWSNEHEENLERYAPEESDAHHHQ